jgi:hypothetical protein
MPRTAWNMFLVIALVLLSAGCTQPIVQREISLPPVVSLPPTGSGDRRVLAGEWEYEDSAVVTLTLDEQGNGTYQWKEGRFETTALSDHTWQGMWFQKENDREGGFTVKFSPDFSEGEGRWWYSRIEDDWAPTQKGGTFRLKRKTSQASASNISLAP